MSGTDFRETLYTVDKRGRRLWVYPSLVKGYFYRRRSAVIVFLVLFYASMPWLEIGGKQAILLDLANRKFILFGSTFWATDGRFLMFVLGGLAMTLFFVTAFVGRAWCGWACPETVFLEFLFRPLENLIEGSPAQRKRLDAAPWSANKLFKKGLKYFLFAGLSWFLASTFLAYFVGAERLLAMMSDYPTNNLSTFLLTLALMGVLLFQFGWFREQFCTVLCPYARFQSVLMDASTVLVGYDARRGEPRSRLTKGRRPDSPAGDCIDCKLCVRVCPTGIDIRNGTQLECIHCAACIDACDSIMNEVGRPAGLVRYDTENNFRGDRSRILRPRIIIYAVFLALYAITFTYLLSTRELSEFQIIRSTGDAPFLMLPDGRLANHFHLHLSNKGDIEEQYRIRVSVPEVQVITPLDPFPVKGGADSTVPIFFHFPPRLLEHGRLELDVTVQSPSGFSAAQRVTLIGPEITETGEDE